MPLPIIPYTTGLGSGFTVSVSPSFLLDTTSSSSGSSSSVTLTPSGGQSPYTYAWSHLSTIGSGVFTGFTSGTSAATGVSYASLGSPGADVTISTKCVVTDNVGNTKTVYYDFTILRTS